MLGPREHYSTGEIKMAEKGKKHHCENCEKELDKGKVCELDGMVLCEDCHDEEENLRATEEEWIE